MRGGPRAAKLGAMTSLSHLYSHAGTVLHVRDLPRARDFYRDVLGFSVEFEWEDPPTYAVLRAGESVQIHLALVDAPLPEGDRPTVLYIFVRDVDALHAEAAKRGAEILRPPETWDYGMREFEARDPDGHCLVFGRGVELDEA